MAVTMEMEEAPSSTEVKDALMQQIQDRKIPNQREGKDAVQEQETDEVDVREQARHGEQMGEGGEEEEEASYSEEQGFGKSLQFQVGDELIDVAEDAMIEFKADGKKIKMTLAEMRDAAAGGTAVRNRMRELAEEKKKIFTPYKNFSKVASSDPMNALKRVFGSIKQIDPETDFNQFLRNLGKQAQSLTQMSPSDRKAYELERELNETREKYTEKELLQNIQERKQELTGEYDLTEDQIYGYGQQILSDPALSASIQNESDLFDRIEDLADEVDRQKAALGALRKFDGKLTHTDPLVFELSTLLEKNPDFNEQDLEEIAEGVLSGVKRSKASKALSRRKQKSQVIRGRKSPQSQDLSKMSPKDALRHQILNKRNGQK